jgi:hypothetical protein
MVVGLLILLPLKLASLPRCCSRCLVAASLKVSGTKTFGKNPQPAAKQGSGSAIDDKLQPSFLWKDAPDVNQQQPWSSMSLSLRRR